MPIWERIGKSIRLADDGCTLVSGKSIEELNNNITNAFFNKCDWYTAAGFVMNALKTEPIDIECIPSSISVAGCDIKHKDPIKFLGMNISSDLKWNVPTEKR